MLSVWPAGRNFTLGYIMKRKMQLVATIAGCLLILTARGLASQEAEVLGALAQLRNIQPTDDDKQLTEINARMDAAWKKIETLKSLAVPIILQELKRELASKTPDQFFLLDTAYLALKLSRKEAEPVALQALARIDPTEKIIQYNDQELFNFTYELAKSGRSEVFAQIDRLFLRPSFKDRGITIPQHAFTLNSKLMCVFLYGISGPDAELHVADLLDSRPEDRLTLLEILYYIGSSKCADKITKTLSRHGDHETVTRGITVLMKNCGPTGKELAQRIDSGGFDVEAKKYYEAVRSEIPKVTHETNAQLLEPFQGSISKLSDEKLKERLHLMYEKFGVEDELSPSVIVKSKLPTDYLIAEMKRIRSRMFYRINPHALDDVLVTNQIITTLEFRD